MMACTVSSSPIILLCSILQHQIFFICTWSLESGNDYFSFWFPWFLLFWHSLLFSSICMYQLVWTIYVLVMNHEGYLLFIGRKCAFISLSDWYLIAGIDTTGGMRVPGGFCGILGFRPSYGTVSTVGVIPVSPSLDTIGMSGKDIMQSNVVQLPTVYSLISR